MPRVGIKGEVKEEKKEESGAWERKKVTHAPNWDKRGSKARKKEALNSFLRFPYEGESQLQTE